MDEALLYDLCGRARLVQIRSVWTEAGLRGLTDLIGRAARCPERYSHARLLALIEAAPRPVGFRYGLRRLAALGSSRTTPPDTYGGGERAEYEAAQTALLASVGRDSGERAPGAIGVARNVLEQFLLRWF